MQDRIIEVFESRISYMHGTWAERQDAFRLSLNAVEDIRLRLDKNLS